LVNEEPKSPPITVKYWALEEIQRFVPRAKICAGLLVFTSAALACVYGTDPVLKVSFRMRGLVCLVWFWSVCGFTVCGAMLAWAWLMDRFPAKPRAHMNPGKRQRRR
jgi:MFS family permease